MTQYSIRYSTNLIVHQSWRQRESIEYCIPVDRPIITKKQVIAQNLHLKSILARKIAKPTTSATFENFETVKTRNNSGRWQPIIWPSRLTTNGRRKKTPSTYQIHTNSRTKDIPLFLQAATG